MSLHPRRKAALVAARIDVAPKERWQHGQDRSDSIAPRMPTSVASGVQALRSAKCIDDAEVTAAKRFSEDYVFGVEGVRDPPEGAGGGGNAHDVQIARANAVTCHRAIEDAIGAAATERLVAFVVMDLSFVAMAALFMPGRANGRIEMRGTMTTLLDLLSRQYSVLDESGVTRRFRTKKHDAS